MAFLGVLVLKGLDSQISTFGLLLVIIASVSSGLVFIIISKIGKSEHPVVIVNYFMVIATIIGGVLSIENWVNPKGIEWLLLFSLGVFGYYGQVYMTKAFQTARPAKWLHLNILKLFLPYCLEYYCLVRFIPFGAY